MNSQSLATRVFTQEDQVRFAEMSGDWNEIHVDREAARRSSGGEQVVHGMHSAMWALDVFLAQRKGSVTSLSATFRRPVHLGEEVELMLVDDDGSTAKLSLVKGSARLIDFRIGLTDPIEVTAPDDREHFEFPTEPIELTIDEIAGGSGTLAVPGDDVWSSTFPELSDVLGDAATAQIAAVSRLVGMVCPGRYSLLSGVDLTIDRGGSARDLEWSVTRADPRVSAVSLALSKGRVTGTVQAFVRPRPTAQPGMAVVKEQIRPDEFEGQRALIVGGSRGLGELTAKLLAAGGAEVVVTWLNSSADAERVAGEIESSGGTAIPQRLDVGDPFPAVRDLSARGWIPTHLYYYATPPIFVRRTSLYDPQLFDRFADIYVGGFARVAEVCREAGAEHLTAFFPSSVAVDEYPEGLLEYAAAKAAGEVAAKTMSANLSWLEVVVRRLPRLPTDQTATFMPVPTADPMTVMVEVVREVSSVSVGDDDDRHNHSE